MLADLGSACLNTTDCAWMTSAHLDDNALATVFWRQIAPSPRIGLQAATNALGSVVTQSHVEASTNAAPLQIQVVPVGGHQFAVLTRDLGWTSEVVDFSSPAAPTVSPSVVLPLTDTAQVISGPDGVFALGADVSNGDIALGAGATAKGVNVQLPNSFTNLWWGTFAPAKTATPSVWWAFNAAQSSAPASGQGVYVARVDVPDGNALTVQPRSLEPWRTSGGTDNCAPLGRNLAMSEYGIGKVTVGWINFNTAHTGCDAFVDGVVLTGDGASAVGGPVVGGSSTGPVAVWTERNLGTGGGYTFRLVWRQRDDVTGNWSAPAKLTDQPLVYLRATANGPGGTLAIAWTACGSAVDAPCGSYVSKYVAGVWSTQQFAQGDRTFGSALAINAAGQAIVAWAEPSTAKVYAYRF